MNNPSINAHRALFNKTRHRKAVSNIVEDSADNLEDERKYDCERVGYLNLDSYGNPFAAGYTYQPTYHPVYDSDTQRIADLIRTKSNDLYSILRGNYESIYSTPRGFAAYSEDEIQNDGYKEACTNSILQFENICVLTGIDLEVEEKS